MASPVMLMPPACRFSLAALLFLLATARRPDAKRARES
jgi:hypothetical protein